MNHTDNPSVLLPASPSKLRRSSQLVDGGLSGVGSTVNEQKTKELTKVPIHGPPGPPVPIPKSLVPLKRNHPPAAVPEQPLKKAKPVEVPRSILSSRARHRTKKKDLAASALTQLSSAFPSAKGKERDVTLHTPTNKNNDVILPPPKTVLAKRRRPKLFDRGTPSKRPKQRKEEGGSKLDNVISLFDSDEDTREKKNSEDPKPADPELVPIAFFDGIYYYGRKDVEGVLIEREDGHHDIIRLPDLDDQIMKDMSPNPKVKSSGTSGRL